MSEIAERLQFAVEISRERGMEHCGISAARTWQLSGRRIIRLLLSRSSAEELFGSGSATVPGGRDHWRRTW